MSEAARRALELAAGIKESAAAIHNSFPAEVRRPQDEPVLPFSLVKGTRGYIEKLVHQINGSYVATCYDACAVMARRLLETLIIEAFEHHRIDHKIKDVNGNFFHLQELVPLTLKEPAWNLGRKCKRLLPRLKDLGDRSAHDRRFNAHRVQIDRLASDLETVVQEFLSLAGLK